MLQVEADQVLGWRSRSFTSLTEQREAFANGESLEGLGGEGAEAVLVHEEALQTHADLVKGCALSTTSLDSYLE